MAGSKQPMNMRDILEKSAGLPASCNISNVSPPCLRDLYGIRYKPPANSRPMAFASYLGQAAQ